MSTGRRGRILRRLFLYGSTGMLLGTVAAGLFLYFWVTPERVQHLVGERTGLTLEIATLERQGLRWVFNEPRWRHERLGKGGAKSLSVTVRPVWDRGPRVELVLMVEGMEWPAPRAGVASPAATHPLTGWEPPFSPPSGWWRRRYGWRLTLGDSPWSVGGLKVDPEIGVDDLGRVEGSIRFGELVGRLHGNLLERDLTLSITGKVQYLTVDLPLRLTWGPASPLELTCGKGALHGPWEGFGSWAVHLTASWPAVARGGEGLTGRFTLTKGEGAVRGGAEWLPGKPWDVRVGAQLPSVQVRQHALAGVKARVRIQNGVWEGEGSATSYQGSLPFLKRAVTANGLMATAGKSGWNLRGVGRMGETPVTFEGSGVDLTGVWSWTVGTPSFDLGDLGRPESSGTNGPIAFSWPAQQARISVGQVMWGGRRFGPLAGRLDYRNKLVTFESTAWTWAGGQGGLSVVYGVSNRQGELSGSLKGAKVSELLAPWNLLPGGEVEGRVNLSGKVTVNGTALGDYSVRGENVGTLRLVDTPFQARLWENPLVSSLKSMEDLLTKASAQIEGNVTNRRTTATGTFASETWRARLDAFEKEGDLWSTSVDLDLSETFLDRYLLPGPLVKAKGHPIPADRLPQGWNAGYRLTVKRTRGNAMGGPAPLTFE